MNPNRIDDYCREHGYDVEKTAVRRKSLIYSLEKNERRFILKKVLALETEDIDQKYKSEIRSIQRINHFSAGRVRAPQIVDTVDDDHFYVCERIEGPTIHDIISSPFYSRSHVVEIHRNLFEWLREFYGRYQRQKDLTREDPVFSLGPYTKKIPAIVKGKDVEAQMVSLLTQSRLPVSVVHGDLTPWNIILRGMDELYIIDWGNSGEDFPAHDVTRYFLQMMRKVHWNRIKSDLIRLFIQSFGPLFHEDDHIFDTILQYHYLYSRNILLKKTHKLITQSGIIRYLRLLFFYVAYYHTVISMNRPSVKSTWIKRDA